MRGSTLFPGTLCLLIASAHVVAVELPAGIWRNQDYGYVIQRDASGTQLFDWTEAHCTRHPSPDAAAWIALSGAVVAEDATHVRVSSGVGLYDFERLDALPPACDPNALRDDNAARNAAVFFDALTRLQLQAGEPAVNWAGVRAEATRRLGDKRNDKQLWNALNEGVAASRDPHVAINDGERELSGQSARFTAYLTAANSTLALQLAQFRLDLEGPLTALTAAPSVRANGKIRTGWLPEQIAYVSFATMGDLDESLDRTSSVEAQVAAARSAIDAVLQEYAGARGLVLDLRMTQGGHDAVALELASRFARETTLAYRKSAARDGSGATSVSVSAAAGSVFHGPVALLIGPMTVGAGETGAQALSVLPSVRTFGAATQGAVSDAIPKVLPNGWTYTLSVERTTLPDGILLERRGVEPLVARGPVPRPEALAPTTALIVEAARWIKDLLDPPPPKDALPASVIDPAN